MKGSKRGKPGARGLAVRAVCALLVVVAVGAYDMVVTTQAQAAAEEAAAERTSGKRGGFLKDGEFEGSARGYGGPTSVTVTVDNGWITKVVVDKEYDDNPYFELASGKLLDEIVQEQSYELDVVSSATFSSRGIMNAVNNALVAGGAVEGTKVGSTSSSSAKAKSTSELKKLAQKKAAEEATPWYETTLGQVLGVDEESKDTTNTTGKGTKQSSTNAGFAGGR